MASGVLPTTTPGLAHNRPSERWARSRLASAVYPEANEPSVRALPTRHSCDGGGPRGTLQSTLARADY